MATNPEALKNTTKPLCEWTLAELKSYCTKHEGIFCDSCPFVNIICSGKITPNEWDFEPKAQETSEKSKYTQEEIELAKKIVANGGKAVYMGPKNAKIRMGSLNLYPISASWFPSLKDGDAVALEDIANGGKE